MGVQVKHEIFRLQGVCTLVWDGWGEGQSSRCTFSERTLQSLPPWASQIHGNRCENLVLHWRSHVACVSDMRCCDEVSPTFVQCVESHHCAEWVKWSEVAQPHQKFLGMMYSFHLTFFEDNVATVRSTAASAPYDSKEAFWFDFLWVMYLQFLLEFVQLSSIWNVAHCYWTFSVKLESVCDHVGTEKEQNRYGAVMTIWRSISWKLNVEP